MATKKKRCSGCTWIKSVAKFHKNRHKKDGLSSECVDCNSARVKKWQKDHPDRVRSKAARWRQRTPDNKKNSHLKSRYGITLTDYVQMLAAQGGGCAICSKLMKKMAVDHDHETKRVRGILCHSCNVALGHLRDSIELLRRAIGYLQK